MEFDALFYALRSKFWPAKFPLKFPFCMWFVNLHEQADSSRREVVATSPLSHEIYGAKSLFRSLTNRNEFKKEKV